MMRLIDADALPIQNVAVRGSGKPNYDVAKAWLTAICDAAPTVDAEPVRHGEWIWNEENDCYICSACGETALNNYRGLSIASEGCPHCRAKMKMKGEKDA